MSDSVLFLGLFAVWAIFRSLYSDTFHEAHRFLSLRFGALNLIAMSFCALASVYAAKYRGEEQRPSVRSVIFLVLTCLLGFLFLAIKFYEYLFEIDNGFLPGSFFRSTDIIQQKAPLFFSVYFLTTGLYVLHVCAGLGLTLLMIRRASRAGLEALSYYWRFLAAIWLMIFSMLYLNLGLLPIALIVVAAIAILGVWRHVGGLALLFTVFFGLTATDIFYRKQVDVIVGPSSSPVAGSENRGKSLYTTNCLACHGLVGRGDGPAASALNPKPRNFALSSGWKNGRKPSQILKTLSDGIPNSAMASFKYLSVPDRLVLIRYVLSFGPALSQDEEAEFTKLGGRPEDLREKDQGSPISETPTISIERAMKLMQE